MNLLSFALLPSLLSVVAPPQGATWKEWPVQEAGFSVEMPGRPYTTHINDARTPDQKVTLFISRAAGETIQINVLEKPGMAWTTADAEIDAFERSYIADERGREVSSKRMHWGPFRAKDTVILADQRHAHLRSIFVGQRIYLIAVRTADNAAKSATARRKLDSFRFIEVEEGEGG